MPDTQWSYEPVRVCPDEFLPLLLLHPTHSVQVRREIRKFLKKGQ
jgi:hypothetical protein